MNYSIDIKGMSINIEPIRTISNTIEIFERQKKVITKKVVSKSEAIAMRSIFMGRTRIIAGIRYVDVHGSTEEIIIEKMLYSNDWMLYENLINNSITIGIMINRIDESTILYIGNKEIKLKKIVDAYRLLWEDEFKIKRFKMNIRDKVFMINHSYNMRKEKC